jgi:hypothetical protein
MTAGGAGSTFAGWLRRLSVVACASGLTLPAQADCHRGLFGTTGLDYRRSLQAELRGIGITGFGRTQPYRDSTISLFLGSDVSLILREQDDVVSEIGVAVPQPAEPLEVARFNALVSHAASRFSGENEAQLRARLLASLGLHPGAGAWDEASDKVRLAYRRDGQALIAKLSIETCS